MLMRSALFWDITRRRVVIVYRRFGTTYRTHLHGSRVRVGNNYLTTPRNSRKGVLLELLTREDGTHTLSRNVGKQLPHDAA
jgi:hypothetical protein